MITVAFFAQFPAGVQFLTLGGILSSAVSDLRLWDSDRLQLGVQYGIEESHQEHHQKQADGQNIHGR